MCQQIIQFCSGSSKPLILAGTFLLLLVSVAIGYTNYTTYALYQDIDPAVAQENSLTHQVQFGAASWMGLNAITGSVAAFYDHKPSILALSLIGSFNFVAAAAAILMVPSGPTVGKLFEDRLQEARAIYNFTDRYPVPSNSSNATLVTGSDISTKLVSPDGAADLSKSKAVPLDANEATRIWDKLQARGCCGFLNATTEWGANKIPKSCCAHPEERGDSVTCKTVDADHCRPCIEVIGATSLNLLIVLALIALVNLYLASVAGISTYRTFRYSEASQNAYP